MDNCYFSCGIITLKKKGRVLENKFVELPIEVESYDIDLAGHVNNVVYVKWLEKLRNKLFSELCSFKDLIENNLYVVVVSTNIRYKKQIRMFDRPVGIMKLADINHGIILLEAFFMSGEKVAATAEQKCVIFNLRTSTKTNITISGGKIIYKTL